MSLLRASATIGGLTLVSRVLGFLRDMLMARFVGAGFASDAFLIAWRLPNLFRALFAEGAFSAAFVPMFNRTVAEGEAKEPGNGLAIALRFAEDVLSILEEYAPWPPYSVIFHCFSGDAAMAERCAAAGYVMSFAGNVTFKNAVPLQEAARVAPAQLMLAETDAPFMTPVPHRGKPNSPAMTAYTIRYLAALKNMDITDFCARLQSTGARVFDW